MKSVITALTFASIATASLANNTFSTTGFSADPLQDAQCAAVFGAVTKHLEKSQPDISKKTRVISHKLASLAAHKAGEGQAGQWISAKVHSLNDERNNGIRPLYEASLHEEFKFCITIAKKYGMM